MNARLFPPLSSLNPMRNMDYITNVIAILYSRFDYIVLENVKLFLGEPLGRKGDIGCKFSPRPIDIEN
jgi:hypothetical protein